MIYYGALVLLNKISVYLFYLMGLFVTWYVSYVLGFFRIEWTVKRKKRLIRLRNLCHRLALPQVSLLGHSVAVIVSLIVIILILVSFQNIGKKATQELVDNIKSNEISELPKITVNIDSSNIELIRVACGTTRCLGIDVKNVQIDVFDMNDIQYTNLTVK